MIEPRRPTTLGLAASFGFGDRLGLATEGHVAAMKSAGTGIAPIFPQQSIREMSRTRRTPDQVMNEALAGMQQAGWRGETGADADHLKTAADVVVTSAAGFTFFTIDPSEFVDRHADSYPETELREKFDTVREEVGWFGEYAGKEILLSQGRKVSMTEEACLRAAVKYGRAIRHAVEMGVAIRQASERRRQAFEIELSVDETDQPTSPAEHFIIADQCLKSGMPLVSLAPRFIGEFEKGVDFKGDLRALEESLREHAAIAKAIGPYKLSLHSGSDKLSTYGMLARVTEGRFHVKTAGTSYLEALRALVRRAPDLFREIVRFARQRYDVDRATYHVSASVADVPAPEVVADDRELERLYLECWEDVPAGRGFTAPGRQILHCTFGSVLTDAKLGRELRSVLETHPADYTEILEIHFRRHLEALRSGM